MRPNHSRIHLYEPPELEHAPRAAGFVEVRVSEPDLEPYAREARRTGKEASLFRGAGGALFLTVRKA